METEFNVEEVFEMARAIEVAAKEFYEQAAQAAGLASSAALFRRLAAMEGDHELVFDGMKELARGGARPGPAGAPTAASARGTLEETHWRAVLDLVLHELTRDLTVRFAGKSGAEILREAIGFERDTIVFYVAMKEAVGAAGDSDRIDAIIREELGHVILLTGELTGLTRSATGGTAFDQPGAGAGRG